jgi:large subunit ribosomal protein L5
MSTVSLKKKYNEEISPALKEKFSYKSVMQVPKLVKISINQGLGSAVSDKKVIDTGVEELSLITGQKAVAVLAKKSVSNFKLREGMPIAVKVTLRGNHMLEFLDRFVNITLPRVRDFKGVKDKGFDGRGNYTLGIQEQLIFPEISLEKVKNVSGMNITFVTTANTDEEGYALLKAFGMPFASKK